MKTLIKLFSCAVAFALGVQELRAVNEEGYTFRNYHQTGLVAHWDAKNYCGEDVSGTFSGNYWNDLVGGRKIRLNGDAYSTELGCHRASGYAYWGCLAVGTTDFLAPTEEGLTVEIAVTMDKYTQTPLFIGPTATGIGIEYSYTSPGGWILSNDNVPNRVGYKPTISRNWDKMPEFWVLSVCYTNGVPCLDHTYLNGTNPTVGSSVPAGSEQALSSSRKLYVMANANAGTGWSPCRIHAIRVYRGKLTAAEAEANRQLDIKRYRQEDQKAELDLRYAFTVQSGSVTVGETVYGAGDYVYYRPDQPVPVVADNAVIVPRQDGTSQISLTSGTLKIAVADESAMTYVKSLALGADAVLSVPAKGLNAVTLTAETGATATGTGMLVSTAATCPVAGYANYLSANYTWTAWPASGIAYVPAGVNLTITAAEAEALDGIAFLDDGTASAKATKVSYTAADALTLKAVMAGPGIFSAVNGGKLTVTGASRHFTGNFYIENTEAQVANEYGLGCGASRPSEVKIGAAGNIQFGNGAETFTVRAPLKLGSTTSASEVIRSEASKKLVFAENFERANYNSVVGGRMKFYGDVTFKKWYKTAGTNYAPTLDDANGRLEFAGPVSFGQTDFYMASSKGPVTYSSMIVEANMISPPALSFSGNHVAVRATSLTAVGTKFQLYSDYTYTLNGCDQDYAYLYGDANSKGTFTSDTPAQVRVIGSSSQTIRPIFKGAVGFTHAADAAVTTTFSGKRVSDTTGRLEVDSGTLALAGGYQWLGTNVVVKGGALVLSDSNCFGKKTCLSIDAVAGGTVTLPTDGEVTVKAFQYNGAWMKHGLYGGAAALAAEKIDADHCLSCFGATSTGVLRVKCDSPNPGLVILVR